MKKLADVHSFEVPARGSLMKTELQLKIKDKNGDVAEIQTK
jgi:hypothetical protein